MERVRRYIVLAGLLLFQLCNPSLSIAEDFVAQAVSVADRRITLPVERIEFSETTILKLSDEYFVISFLDNSQNTLLRILAEICTQTQQPSVVDAAVLRPTETAEEFFEHNENFLLTREEQLSYVLCMKAGMRLHDVNALASDGSAPAEERMLERCPERAVIQMNLWARFFNFQKDFSKAREFFVFSLEKQTEAIANLSRGSDMTDLDRLLRLFDGSQPFELFTLDLSKGFSDWMTLDQYLKTVIHAREKLVLFYPAQIQLLNRDRDLSKTLAFP